MSVTSRRRAARAAAPVAGLLAAGLLVWQGSYAAFSASTDNTDNTWTAGTLTLQNNGGTGTFASSTPGIINATGIKPGDTESRCLTVDSTGTSGGELAVYRGGITNTDGLTANGGVGLSDRIQVDIESAVLGTGQTVVGSCAVDGGVAGSVAFPAGSASTVESGLLNALPTTYAGAAATTTTAAGERVAYRITWTFVSGGSTLADNPYQGASSVADLVWEIQ